MTATNSPKGSLLIEREKTLVDFLRSYKIILDGHLVGELKNGESLTFPLSEGQHVLRLKIDIFGSRDFRFSSDRDSQLNFRCTPAIKNKHLFIPFLPAIILVANWKEYTKVVPFTVQTRSRLR